MKKITLTFLLVFTVFTVFNIFTKQATSEPSGAIPGVTGSPADGVTCSQAGCHNGTPTVVPGIITSNVPVDGYVPGTTYTITITSSGSGAKGFQVSPQATNGTLVGTLIAGTGTKIVGAKYVTHSASKGAATAIWNFQWKAPVAGTGDVTFYGAFAVTRNTTRKSTLLLTEAATNGVGIIANSDLKLELYPNPSSEMVSIKIPANTTNGTILIYDLQGKIVLKSILEKDMVEAKLNISELIQGQYALRLITDNSTYTSNFIKN